MAIPIGSQQLITHLKKGGKILMDGAMGTEIERRGNTVEASAWSALAVDNDPDLVSAIHLDFLQAGCQMHIANSFSLGRHVLEPVGLAGDFERLNRRSVELFDIAVKQAGLEREQLWLAGSVSTYSANSNRSALPGLPTMYQNCRDQAALLADAGVDLFALEMLFDIDVTLTMCRAVAEQGLPIILGFTCDDSGPGDAVHTRSERMGCGVAPLATVLAGVMPKLDAVKGDAEIILSIMHTDPIITDRALDILVDFWDGPVAVYPNSGVHQSINLQFDTVCQADDFAADARRWHRRGIQIIGGCCGISPDHIRAAAVLL